MNINTHRSNPLSKQRLRTLVKNSLEALQSVKKNLPTTPTRSIGSHEALGCFEWYEGSIGEPEFAQVGRHHDFINGVTSLVCTGPGRQGMVVTFRGAPLQPKDEGKGARWGQMSFQEHLEEGGEELVQAFKAIARGEEPEPTRPQCSDLDFVVENMAGPSQFTYLHDSTVKCDLLDGEEVDIKLGDQKLPPFEVWRVGEPRLFRQ